MSIFTMLDDYGEFSYASGFNGKLADYVNEFDDANNDFFRKILAVNEDCRIYRNFGLRINCESIANKKIAYRDINKIPEGFGHIPYILYWKSGEAERGILLNLDSYLDARGVYYAVTEPKAALEEVRGDIVAMYLGSETEDLVLEMFTKMQNPSVTAGSIQKRMDQANFADEEEMRDRCSEIAKAMFAETMEKAKDMNRQEKTELIYKTVFRAFLLKKGLYVKYMTNKRLLTGRHSNNPVEQRQFAKAYADEIEIIPFFNLWNGYPEEEK